ncbi:MAG: metal-dependent hydrolase [Xanthomonadales bacterium]|nr:metal-dependent hydrolase [Xanthomonadales bacterium]
MDPICHTLVGASLACTGLEKKARFGRSTLIIAANLPDIDVAAMFWGGAAAYGFRRGITHGLPALVVLPVILALLMLALSRLRPARDGVDSSFRCLLLLSAIGVVSHPMLDWLNTYGMRWLMPMVDQWYYGDTLFIVDWMMWLILATGLLLTRRMASGDQPALRRPAVLALLTMTAYVGANFAITQQAERVTLAELQSNPPTRLMASPVALNPLRRDLVLEYPDEYRFATYRLNDSPTFAMDPLTIARGDPADLELARQDRDGAWFLHWARFPYSVSQVGRGQRVIKMADARYVRQIDNPRLDGFGVFTVTIREGEGQ